MACASNPTPYTLHPTPYTLHPTPYTLHPSPFTLHPELETLNQGPTLSEPGWTSTASRALLVPSPPSCIYTMGHIHICMEYIIYIWVIYMLCVMFVYLLCTYTHACTHIRTHTTTHMHGVEIRLPCNTCWSPFPPGRGPCTLNQARPCALNPEPVGV